MKLALWAVFVFSPLFMPVIAESIETVPGVTTLVWGKTLDPGSYDTIGLDPLGNLYITSGSGVIQVTPDQTVSPWSSARAFDITFGVDGLSYGAGRATCHCIEQYAGNGAASPLLTDTHEWTWLALLPDGTLYANIWAGEGRGLYRIDRGTGLPTAVISGGPGPNGSGWYWDMAAGTDGALYVLGSDGTVGGHRLFRLDGSTLVPVATPTNPGSWLAAGPAGRFLVAASGAFTGLYNQGNLWLVDPASGASTLLARASTGFHQPDAGFSGVAYDPSRQLIYALETNGRLSALALNQAVPAVTDTWGSVKARYRR